MKMFLVVYISKTVGIPFANVVTGKKIKTQKQARETMVAKGHTVVSVSEVPVKNTSDEDTKKMAVALINLVEQCPPLNNVLNSLAYWALCAGRDYERKLGLKKK
ncbi:MAG: hypothetical protein EXS55_00080 [Candidatus Magasanikbacteria bacterium]|nr:hypothetical protein [Candidatus Magasanikbacteria bacterium]